MKNAPNSIPCVIVMSPRTVICTEFLPGNQELLQSARISRGAPFRTFLRKVPARDDVQSAAPSVRVALFCRLAGAICLSFRREIADTPFVQGHGESDKGFPDPACNRVGQAPRQSKRHKVALRSHDEECA